MLRIGFHASHEQISPRRLLADVRHAEQAGFAMAMCSDHVAPWSERQGHSGNTWPWLGAALATTGFRIGTLAIPGPRYHPAVLAHQYATLAQMFPGRVWAALGSGEALNEHITGAPWPPKAQRVEHLEASADVIRRLLAGEEVSREGPVTVDRAQLWDRPEQPPPLLAAAISSESARRAAAWADGLVTVVQPVETLREVVSAYRDAGGRGPLALQLHLSWAPTLRQAEQLAIDQWRTNVFPADVAADTETTQEFDALAETTDPAAVHESVRISEDLGRHREWIAEYAGLGFDEIYLHHVGQDQRPFLDVFGDQVLPALVESTEETR
ncbi:TIGR03885 family FMN-dependent LLM class oxidoreductase [Ornithinimicrobium sp. F0845]|uniref:TIGR03885 family FMN-dependent LLM class oxidoreductase n=1 Tax=Ornithinimicrobium sp. F0845 TaxID=2926412 RepID=UPI001FF40B93|nr:TIGR03885 family FMN-dependent LLM class oxidoreductase [Ornithinimicrobium sp. F0845]MCK0111029.1 TIGR03885 family FMN-dependent LLM class oxidoreductase [Ornithinimicrobium sp. F0845]